MSLFDNLYVQVPLPGIEGTPSVLETGWYCQTHDLEECMTTYTITERGHLLEHVFEWVPRDDPDPLFGLTHQMRDTGERKTVSHHGDITFWLADRAVPQDRHASFLARFTEGRLQWVRPHNRCRICGRAGPYWEDSAHTSLLCWDCLPPERQREITESAD